MVVVDRLHLFVPSGLESPNHIVAILGMMLKNVHDILVIVSKARSPWLREMIVGVLKVALNRYVLQGKWYLKFADRIAGLVGQFAVERESCIRVMTLPNLPNILTYEGVVAFIIVSLVAGSP